MTKITNITYATLTALLIAVIAAGCIKNDIPYPRIQPNITSLEVRHQSQAAQLDTINRIATVYLDETADIYNVDILQCTLSDKASFVGDSIAGSIDLSQPRYYILQIYQEYVYPQSRTEHYTQLLSSQPDRSIGNRRARTTHRCDPAINSRYLTGKSADSEIRL